MYLVKSAFTRNSIKWYKLVSRYVGKDWQKLNTQTSKSQSIFDSIHLTRYIGCNICNPGKIQEGSRWFKKVQKSDILFKRVQESLRRFKRVQEGLVGASGRFNKVQKFLMGTSTLVVWWVLSMVLTTIEIKEFSNVWWLGS